MRRLSAVFIALYAAALCAGCATLPKPTTQTAPSTTHPEYFTVVGNDQQPQVGVWVILQPDLMTQPYPAVQTDAQGRVGFQVSNTLVGGETVTVTSPNGYVTTRYNVLPASCVTTPQACNQTPWVVLNPFPAPPTRAEILGAHESFQGAVLHTTQFGDLNWWPTAWTSLNPQDRADSYPQIASWGDTDITVSAKWDYGESGQPYGTGQLVPPTDYIRGNVADPAFRASVKDVVMHTARNGRPFIPRVFMSCDDGPDPCTTYIPIILAALEPQANDPIDLTQYVKFQICYDSCIPGWQPPSLIDSMLVSFRAQCASCVISIEFGSGYPFWGGDLTGLAQFQSPAGQALDELDWEGNSWPVSNPDQYWQVMARWLGPCYVRGATQPSDDDAAAPFQPGDGRWYTQSGTPRGPYGLQWLEPFTYQWVRGQVAPDQVPQALQYIRALQTGDACAAIDLPQ